MKHGMKVAMLVLAGILAFSAAAGAHPPVGLSVSYKADEGLLKIDIRHPVGNASDHYIREVDVDVDGEDVAGLKYSGQMDRQGQTVLLTIGFFKEGTGVSVEAECNKFGDLEFTGRIPASSPGEFVDLE